jgi:hypothetical protein
MWATPGHTRALADGAGDLRLMECRRGRLMKMNGAGKKRKFYKSLAAAGVFFIGGSAVHLVVMLIDFFLMPNSPHMNLQSDFFGSVMAIAMLPMVAAYGVCLMVVYYFWQRAKKALALAYIRDAQRKEAEEIVQAMQRLTGILAEHLSVHNAEILLWVNNRRQKTGSVPTRIERSSHKIAEAMRALSEVSFVAPYVGNRPVTLDEFEKVFLSKLHVDED